MWDDDIAIYKNPNLTGLDVSSIVWAFSDSTVTMRYVPLSLLAWNTVYQLFELNPLGYHLANWLLHIANSVLLFVVIGRILSKTLSRSGSDSGMNFSHTNLAAFLAVLFWAVNPLRVEPVAWATDLTYGLALCFILISLLCYTASLDKETDRARYRRLMGYSVIAYAASLLSHPIGISYFLVLPVIDIFLFRRLRKFDRGVLRKIIIEKSLFAMPALGVSALAVLFRLHAPGPYNQTAAFSSLELADRLMQAAYTIVYYVWRPFYPVNLSPVYTTFLSFDPLSVRFLLSLAVLVACGCLLYFFRRRFPAVLAVGIALAGLSIPVVGFFEYPFFHSDRYTHLATIPMLFLIAMLLMRLLQTYPIGRVLPIPVAVLCAWSLMSIRQTDVWQDSESLFTHTIELLGDHPYRGDLYMRLGKFRFENNQPDAAAEALEISLRLNPYQVIANDYLSEIEFSRGNYSEAIRRMEMVLQRYPESYLAHSKLAYIYHVLKRPDKAAYHYARARDSQAMPQATGL